MRACRVRATSTLRAAHFPLSSVASRCAAPMPLPTHRSPPVARRARRARHRRERRSRRAFCRCACAASRRDRGPARTRRAQARSALRRHRRGRVIRSRRSCRSTWRRRAPRISPTSPARCRRSTAASMRSSTPPCCSARSGPIEHQSFDAWLATLRVDLLAPFGLTRALAAAVARRPGRERRCSRSIRAARIRRPTGAPTQSPRRACPRCCRDPRRRMGKRRDAARQRRRARPDALAAARADASGRRHHATAPARSVRRRSICICCRASRRAESGQVIDGAGVAQRRVDPRYCLRAVGSVGDRGYAGSSPALWPKRSITRKRRKSSCRHHVRKNRDRSRTTRSVGTHHDAWSDSAPTYESRPSARPFDAPAVAHRSS